ncbi:uncharacterized protein LOC107463698 isoform X1 [Arachis duranensis]|uniref:Uncharacterized protein n=2 Tax=Arachis TaxID=3817 RepID=A0A445BQR7_ARAHY|nr:uncharacterized protein LOC112709662 isoform X1 [Arachis hypogaea]XP_025675200.1 uncharacterized protein LOC112775639 isoform X1 [Arachis hypogaea]XP_052110431.1 uncharacterized protein LOC107463698 isoform X1 [Arachis duranensis]RYR41033.1 hypothetical protein Ahy_A09g046764 isoform A [Arachis hypogaea]
MLGTAIRLFAKKPKPKMGPIELKTPPEQRLTITRVLFDIVKEHGPLTVQDTWEHVKEVGLKDLKGKQHMKIVLRWMRERQKLRLICNHNRVWHFQTPTKDPSLTCIAGTKRGGKHGGRLEEEDVDTNF